MEIQFSQKTLPIPSRSRCNRYRALGSLPASVTASLVAVCAEKAGTALERHWGFSLGHGGHDRCQKATERPGTRACIWWERGRRPRVRA